MGAARPHHSAKPSRPARGATSAPAGRNGGAVSTPDIHFVRGVLRVTIPSSYAASRKVQETIMHAVQEKGFPTDTVFAIRIALEEALVNAIKHGNRLDAHKTVFVEAHISPKKAEIIVEDQGPGFDRSCVPDPTAEENLHKCSGRGILLIEAYMDTKWTKGGRRVKMIKRVK